MRAAVFLAVLALLVSLGAGREAHALTADCLEADPKNFDEVYACMSSFRGSRGENMFVNNIATNDCMSVRKQYRTALYASMQQEPMPTNKAEANRRLARLNAIMKDESLAPSCEILARASKEMTGATPFWGGCLGFGSVPQEQHLKSCLETFVPGYYGRERKTESLQGCGDVLNNYEAGLKAASLDQKLPKAYVRPDCTVAADYLASLKPKPAAEAQARPKWEPCMDYDPGNALPHVRKCLGLAEKIPAGAFLSLTNCQSVRAAYESGLQKAYARLPDTYVILPCSVADVIVADVQAEKARIEDERRRADIERMRAEALRQANVPAPDRGFFSGATITWVVLGGIVLALVLAGWMLLKRRVRQG
ncbi:MAG: hypothetical protein IPK66_06145 [Rhodospirillales bacterium]|nr:hypothetical protein [Rhodospirillales bacterium]